MRWSRLAAIRCSFVLAEIRNRRTHVGFSAMLMFILCCVWPYYIKHYFVWCIAMFTVDIYTCSNTRLYNSIQPNLQCNYKVNQVALIVNLVFLAFDFCRFCVAIRFFPTTTANDLQLRRISIPYFIHYIVLSYLYSSLSCLIALFYKTIRNLSGNEFIHNSSPNQS